MGQKRGRGGETDRIVQEALKQEEMQKKQKKEGADKPQGKTLSEIEEEEGGWCPLLVFLHLWARSHPLESLLWG